MADTRNMKLRITRGMLAAYEEAMKDMMEDIRSYCASRNVGYIPVVTDQPIEKVLFGEMLKVGIMV